MLLQILLFLYLLISLEVLIYLEVIFYLIQLTGGWLDFDPIYGIVGSDGLMRKLNTQLFLALSKPFLMSATAAVASVSRTLFPRGDWRSADQNGLCRSRKGLFCDFYRKRRYGEIQTRTSLPKFLPLKGSDLAVAGGVFFLNFCHLLS